MADTPIIDYRRQDIRENYDDLVAPYDPTPPWCAGIAFPGNRYGYWVILNTDEGYIYLGAPEGRPDEPEPELNGTLGSPLDEADIWRDGFNVYTPADFFALCKKRFRELNWIGLGQWECSCMKVDMNWNTSLNPTLALTKMTILATTNSRGR